MFSENCHRISPFSFNGSEAMHKAISDSMEAWEQCLESEQPVLVKASYYGRNNLYFSRHRKILEVF